MVLSEIRQKKYLGMSTLTLGSLSLPSKAVAAHSSSKSPFMCARPRGINAAGKKEAEL